MSVIAKLSIRGRDVFGSGILLTLGCIGNNDLMAAYATSDEDKLFTKYSPWGEMKLYLEKGWDLGEEGEFYAMITSPGETTNLSFPDSSIHCKLTVGSITDFGDNMARRLDMRDAINKEDPRKGVTSFNWKMSVDNPPVFDQLKAGKFYWLALYDAKKFTQRQVIELAHA